MLAAYTHNMKGGGVGGTPQGLDAWQREAGKPHAHMHNTCWPNTCSRGRNNNTHGAHITARVHMAAQNEGGGRAQREGGWV